VQLTGRHSRTRRYQQGLQRKYPVHTHSKQAIDEYLAGVADSKKGRLIMACGAGKTLVGLWECESSGSIRTLVLIPSLSLIKQISRKRYDSSIEPFPALSVCSDQSTKGHRTPLSLQAFGLFR
jgi:predicted helicase